MTVQPLPEPIADAGITRLALSTPFAVGRVNAYLVEDDPLTLIDSGPNSATTLVELEQALAKCGHAVEDLRLIVISHQHMDHFGLVEVLARRSGADVAALDLLGPWLAGVPASMDADDVFAEHVMAHHGVPSDLRSVLRTVASTFYGWGAPATVTVPLIDRTQLSLRDRVLTVHHRPGHSPSDIVLHDADNRILLAGDHLISHISSNPVLTRPLQPTDGARPQALVSYISSLKQTQALDLDLVLPGHGEPIRHHQELISTRLAMHDRRRDKLEGLICERPRSAWELACALWGNVAVTQAYLTISEVLGHVDLLLNEGRVREIVDGESITRFEAS